MLCQVCGEKEANFHMTKIINGEKEEKHICDECAKTVEGGILLSDIKLNNKFSFQDMLSGLIDYMNPSTKTALPSEVSCDVCGTTYRDFREKGLLGCSQCYSTFKSTVDQVVRRVQPSLEHRGKIPKTSGKQILLKREILRLKQELQKAISLEEFEKAAEIRDELRKLNS